MVGSPPPADRSAFIQTLVQNALTDLYASDTGLSIIVIFDEFQRLDQVLYYDQELTRKCHPYTGSFSSVNESTWAPMLIAGSQVTMLSRRALGGAMAGRVGRVLLDRMPLDGGAELARKLAREQGFELPLELAYTISRLTRGHPYYSGFTGPVEALLAERHDFPRTGKTRHTLFSTVLLLL